MTDAFGKPWRKGELHAWLSNSPDPVESAGMIPPMGKVAIALIVFSIVFGALLTVGGGYYAIGKIQELSEQRGSYANTGYDDGYSTYNVDEAAPESTDAAPYQEDPAVEETPAPNADNQVTGVLSADSPKMATGEFAYQLDLTVQAGLKITVDLTSSDFGTYLVVLGPNGENWQNDDFEGNLHQSQVIFTAEKEGIYNILATTSTIGETGEFKIEWKVGE